MTGLYWFTTFLLLGCISACVFRKVALIGALLGFVLMPLVTIALVFTEFALDSESYYDGFGTMFRIGFCSVIHIGIYMLGYGLATGLRYVRFGAQKQAKDKSSVEQPE